MDTATATDPELVLASISDPHAFGTVFDRHAPMIFRFVSRRVGLDLAKDVTAETFRIAFERRDAFDPTRGNLLPWLFGIATNVLRSHLRAEHHQLKAIRAEGNPQAELEDADARLDAEAAGPILAGALLELSVQDRDTLLLFAWTDLGYEGVARALDIPIGTVGSRLSRARKVVRRELRRAGWSIELEEGVDG